jgi:hypothetical protein
MNSIPAMSKIKEEPELNIDDDKGIYQEEIIFFFETNYFFIFFVSFIFYFICKFQVLLWLRQ